MILFHVNRVRPDRILQENGGIPQAGKIGIPAKIFRQLTDGYVIASPERYPVHLPSEKRRRVCGNEKLVIAEAFSGADRQGFDAGEAYGQYFYRIGCRFLRRHEEPLIRFRKAPGYGAVHGIPLGLCLLTWWGLRSRRSFSDRIDSQARKMRTA
jgi:hypothetical protein